MPRRIGIFLAVSFILSPAPTYAGPAQDRVDPGDAAAPRQTAAGRFGGNGIARALYNMRERPEGLPAVEAARRFIERHTSLFGTFDGARSLQAVAERNVRGGAHIRFQQYIDGIPVYRGEMVVSLDARGAVSMTMNSTYPGTTPVTTEPVLEAARALSLARTHLGATGRSIGEPDRCSLVIVPLSEQDARLAYRVNITTESPLGDWEVLVDASSGSILGTEDLFVCYQGGTPGSGYVYLPDPVSAARRVYGEPGLIDGDDAGSTQLDAFRTLVRLDSLTYSHGKYYLAGPGCTVADIESPEEPDSYAQASPDSFRHSRNQPGFEAVMAYYHATEAHRRVLQLGYATPALAALRIDPHGFAGKDNSHYSPSGNWIGLGTGGVDDGEDAAVIWHEYGHAIHWTLAPGWGGGEMAALGEGYADYWAGSYLRSLGLWLPWEDQYNWLFLWDGHNEYWTGRRLDDPRPYPFGALSIHSAGAIWASALMGIQRDLGRDITDDLVLKSIMYLGYGATAVDAAQALLQADRDLFDGRHLPTLGYWLRSVKGFLPTTGELSLLVIADSPTGGELRSEGKAVTMPLRNGVGSLNSLAPQRLTVEATTFAGLDTCRLSSFSAVALLGGMNPEPFNDPARRTALVTYVSRGGRLLVEGGEVAFFYRPRDGNEVDREFRTKVLHSLNHAGDAEGSAVVRAEAGASLFEQPQVVSSVLGFVPEATFADRDAVTIPAGEDGTLALAGWADIPGTASVISHNAGSGGQRTLFLAFALSGLQDSVAALEILENAVSYLLTPESPTAVLGTDPAVPHGLRLEQNYPNPFNPATTIPYTLPEEAYVSIRVYSTLGQEVGVLADGIQPAGVHAVVWNTADSHHAGLASGMYVCRLSAHSRGTGQHTELSRPMILLR